MGSCVRVKVFWILVYEFKVFWVLVCEFTVFGDLMYEFRGFLGDLNNKSLA